MDVIFFTKFLKGFSAEEVGAAVKALGLDGLDVAIRDGQCVNPGNAAEALPAAMATWRAQGLSVPLASLNWDVVDPAQPGVETIFRACGAAGIPYIKLGYWMWSPKVHYWDQISVIRRALEEFQHFGEKYGVCTLVHTHSDQCYASNASGAMHCVQGFDPRYVGVYVDPAHLAADGEELAMGLDIVRDYLKMVGVKNVRYLPVAGVTPPWSKDFCLLRDGLVDWTNALKLLRQQGFSGPLSLHGEYTEREAWSDVQPLVEQDAPYLRSCLAEE